MASGFGTFVSGTTITNGATAAATLSQSVDTTNRTVTVSLRFTAAYHRTASGNWTPGNNVAIWGSQNNSNNFSANLDGTTDSISGVSIGVASVGGITYSNGGSYTIPAGQIQVRSGYYGDKTVSKTYTYDASGSAITGTWSIDMYIPGLSTTHVTASGSFTTDSITPAITAILYGSVNGQAKKIKKLYGSVNGQTKEIKKLYASVGGVTKKIFEAS